jgi:anti-sigma factor RsiW
MMNHVLDRLPDWVAGDLDGPEAEGVRAHLDRCQGCRAAADRIREGWTWLQEAMDPPFSAADHADLRRAILDRLRQERPPQPAARFAPRAAFLALAAAALLLLALAPPWRHVPPAPGRPAPPPWNEAHAPLLASPTQAESPRAAPPRLAQARPTPRTAPDRNPAPTRIEFQTSDPTVRIIWLAQATPPSRPPFTPSEEP